MHYSRTIDVLRANNNITQALVKTKSGQAPHRKDCIPWNSVRGFTVIYFKI